MSLLCHTERSKSAIKQSSSRLPDCFIALHFIRNDGSDYKVVLFCYTPFGMKGMIKKIAVLLYFSLNALLECYCEARSNMVNVEYFIRNDGSE